MFAYRSTPRIPGTSNVLPDVPLVCSRINSFNEPEKGIKQTISDWGENLMSWHATKRHKRHAGID